MKKKTSIGIILGAARVREELVLIFGDIPSALIPINSRPALFLILDHMKSIGIRKVYVSVGYHAEEVQLLLAAYSKERGFVVEAVAVDVSKKSGTALGTIVRFIPKEERRSSIYVHTADTVPIHDVKPSWDKNFVLVSPEYKNSELWSVVKTQSKSTRVATVFEKEKGREGHAAIIGVYHFTNLNVFDRIPHKDYEISLILERLLKRNIPIETVAVKEWLDVGHLEQYYRAQTRLLPTRSFNELRPGESCNTVFKRSHYSGKIKEEILWYLNLPDNLKIHAPRILSHRLDDAGDIYAELEFYGYPSLSSLWVYEKLPEALWRVVIDRLFDIVDTFRSYRGGVDLADYIDMYATKTEERARESARMHPDLAAFYGADTVIVNGIELRGWPVFRHRLKEYARTLYNTDDNCFLHGDLCFPNILFDLNCGVVKLIDPRGTWGSQRKNGDIKYDIAKIRQSVSGSVDHMLYNHAHISYTKERKENPPAITCSFPLIHARHDSIVNYADQKIRERWELNQIKLIEALQFVSMVPLHADNRNRQIAMFARGIILLNEVVNSTSA